MKHPDEIESLRMDVRIAAEELEKAAVAKCLHERDYTTKAAAFKVAVDKLADAAALAPKEPR